MDQLLLFRRVEYRAANGCSIAISSPKAQLLLAYLALQPGHSAARVMLANLFWEDAPDPRANLRKTLSRLREIFSRHGADPLIINTQSIALDTTGLQIDALEIEHLQTLATPESLQGLVTLLGGEFCEGIACDGEELSAWLEAERRRFSQIAEQARKSLAQHYIATGAVDAAIGISLARLADDALNEDVHRDLMQLYLHQDRIGAALKQYELCEVTLRDELGISPSAETQRVLASVKRKAPQRTDGTELTRELDTVPERDRLVVAINTQREYYRRALNHEPSIAVLAFDDAENNEQNGLGITFAEEVATALGRFRELEVMAPSTAYAYRESALNWPSISKELGVNYLCGGRVAHHNGKLVLTARLLEAASGRQIWAERFATSFDDLFDVQGDLVARIATRLIGKIETDRLKALSVNKPQDTRAYELWLRGRNALRQPGRDSLEQAADYFQQALARAPEYARAHVGLAMTMLGEGACYRWNHWVFLKEEALALARKALESDPDDPHAHCILGMTEFYRGHPDSALGRLRHALNANPNDPDVLAHAAVGFALLGEHGAAVDAGRRALRITPYYPEWYAAFAGIALFAAREYREAINTMSAAPEALCNTGAFVAASYAYLGEEDRCEDYRATVRRHHRHQTERGDFPAQISCLNWLLALDPFHLPDDLEHYATGLKRSGFDADC